ncbi:lytic transglycosylase [Streptomyces armeniacus]|uniref:Lytic transglycosylase n=1 Tax=Streptomyces armeniacus TaxID=83291 RepID=A0A345XLV7_9ACTN|nr:transglycosylase SLT domain-containing protein [Streptomyces armeniacus]AXK32623.1 lytic transglycosylase [Streptomyces armeniacus]
MLSINRFTRMSKTAKHSTAGVVAGAAALSLAVVPGSADSGDSSQSTAAKADTMPVAFTGKVKHPESQQDGIAQQVDAVERAQAKAAAKKKAAEAKRQAAAKAEAAEAAKKREAKQPASRSAERPQVKKAAKPNFPNNLDGWIREARSIMKEKGIPGSYEGIHRNIIRESGGDPNAINDWDINAQNGVPSKGLLQVIKPTFEAYHVKGTPKNLTDPVANIVAACNYAADRYGSMDNVDSAY